MEQLNSSSIDYKFPKCEEKANNNLDYTQFKTIS